MGGDVQSGFSIPPNSRELKRGRIEPFHPFRQTMGGKDQLQRYHRQGRTLWRDLRTQGYRVRVRHVGIPSIQAVPAERVPAVERGGTGPARLECETGTVKDNYRIHTDAIRQNLIPVEVTPAQAGVIYAEEADVLNVAMFGMTARMWREQNPGLKGNIRDYASINELICLSNMENLTPYS